MDGSSPGADQQRTIPWQTYQDDGAGSGVIYGGRPLGDPPVSVDVPSYVRPKGATPFSVPLVPAFEPCTSPKTVMWPEGAHTFAVRARDAAGNLDPTPAEQTFTIDRTGPKTT